MRSINVSGLGLFPLGRPSADSGWKCSKTAWPRQVRRTFSSRTAIATPRLSSFRNLTGGETITPATLSVTGITADDKRYDGTTTATLNTSGAALVGVVNGDAVTLDTSAAVGTFASAGIGNNITVAVAGLDSRAHRQLITRWCSRL
jgi:hypothetical protein